MAQQKYFIGDALEKPAIHHESFRALWETKWKTLCAAGVYPFMYGSIHDFEPVVREIIKRGLREPYDWDEYAAIFFPKAEELVIEAGLAESRNEKGKAAEYYLRSSAVYRIARFPTCRSLNQFEGMAKRQRSILQGPKSSTTSHTRNSYSASAQRCQRRRSDSSKLSSSSTASSDSPAPLTLIVTGLDGYRTELAIWQEGFRTKGVATLVIEIPGTGDSPADRRDPRSPDRQWTSVLDWIEAQPELDSARIIAWGFSTGGYYTLRMAHTHHDRLLGCISLGGGAHHMFDADWLRRVNKLEYPFDLANTLAHKFGYTTTSTTTTNASECLEDFIRNAGKYSLLNDGTLDDLPCTRVLLVNGADDEIFPIDDMFVALQHGTPKEARIVPRKKHMGEPESFVIILKWIHDILGLDGDVVGQLRMIPTRTMY